MNVLSGMKTLERLRSLRATSDKPPSANDGLEFGRIVIPIIEAPVDSRFYPIRLEIRAFAKLAHLTRDQSVRAVLKKLIADEKVAAEAKRQREFAQAQADAHNFDPAPFDGDSELSEDIRREVAHLDRRELASGNYDKS